MNESLDGNMNEMTKERMCGPAGVIIELGPMHQVGGWRCLARQRQAEHSTVRAQFRRAQSCPADFGP